MANYRISVTLLDAYNTFLHTNEESYGFNLTYEMLANQIKGIFVPSDKMKIGTKLHEFIEGEPISVGQIVDYETGDFVITKEIYDTINNFRATYPHMIHELKATKKVQIGIDTITLVGKVDGINGYEVHDHKFTGRIDLEKYYESYQWRYYLWMWDQMHSFVYNLFKVDHWEDPNKIDGEQFVMYPYDGLEDDCYSLLLCFVNFVKAQGLDDYLICL